MISVKRHNSWNPRCWVNIRGDKRLDVLPALTSLPSAAIERRCGNQNQRIILRERFWQHSAPTGCNSIAAKALAIANTNRELPMQRAAMCCCHSANVRDCR